MKALLLVLLLMAPALAVEPGERLADPKLEAQAREIGRTLRCLVCQNESIDESGADLARDIRVLLRERLTAGDTPEQARRFIVARYGDFVLLQPPVRPATYVLWFGPPAILLAAGAGTLLWLRGRRPVTAPAPLDAQEQARLRRLLEPDA